MGTLTPASLHVDTAADWRGGQQQVAYLVGALHSGGHRVGVVCPTRSRLLTWCRDHEVPCFALPMRGELDLLAGARIARLCRRHGFGLLHLHTAHAVTLGLWAKMLMPSLRTVATRRVDFPVGRNPFSRWKYGASRLDRIVCISSAVKDILVADGIEESRLVVIPSGVDLDRFARVPRSAALREALGIGRDKLAVGTVAALAAHKDYPTLLQAAAIVTASHERVNFVAVGDGPLRHRLRALVTNLGLDRRFVFAGFQEDVGPYLRVFDLFVLASRTEGLGTSLIDALAAGLPVVATRTGGIPEIVEDGMNGLLVPPRDPLALAQAILRLVADESLRARLAQAARPSVARFAIEATVGRYLALYEDLARGLP